jgi:hypothetical protein
MVIRIHRVRAMLQKDCGLSIVGIDKVGIDKKMEKF